MISALLNLDISSVIAMILAVVFSMSVHEMAHALVSYAFGDPTAKRMGRLSLNPFAHIDWSGILCLLFFGFGWAKPVPIDSSYYKNERAGIIWTSFAGPAANFLLSFICVLIYYALLMFGNASFLAGWFGSFLLNLLSTTAVLSCGFGVFNLIPIPPLDGAKIFWSFLPDEQYYQFMKGNRYLYLVFILLMVSGLVSAPLITMRSTLIEWMSSGAFAILSMF